jgi:hypothetical protein
VLIAFDADYKTNPAVTRQLARLIAARERDVAAHHLKTGTRIVTWVGCKGIDDAVRANICLKTMTILEWISALDERLLRETWTAFGQFQYSPTPSIKAWVRNKSIF